MKGHRAGRTGDSRRATGQGGVVIKRCGCSREVLSAFRGIVTPATDGTIERVEANGDVVGRCECGRTVTWRREVRRALVMTG